MLSEKPNLIDASGEIFNQAFQPRNKALAPKKTPLKVHRQRENSKYISLFTTLMARAANSKLSKFCMNYSVLFFLIL